MPYIVMDSAFYSGKNIIECSDLKWVTRLPETLKEVKALYSSIDRDAMTIAKNGYRYLPVESLWRYSTVLTDNREYIWDRKNRLTNRPTIRRVCMIFEDVLLLYHDDDNVGEPMNIREEHTILRDNLWPGYKKKYFL